MGYDVRAEHFSRRGPIEHASRSGVDLVRDLVKVLLAERIRIVLPSARTLQLVNVLLFEGSRSG